MACTVTDLMTNSWSARQNQTAALFGQKGLSWTLVRGAMTSSSADTTDTSDTSDTSDASETLSSGTSGTSGNMQVGLAGLSGLGVVKTKSA